MTTTIFKCKDCGTIMVIDIKDVWTLNKCTKCESKNIINLEDDFSLAETTGDIEDNE